MFSTRKRLATGAALAMLAVPAIAACGSSDDSSDASASSSSSSSSQTQSAPKPVASIDSLTGNTTAIKLDSGFTDALTSLKLTPGTVGTAKLQNGSLIFPITGGNVTYFEPGTVSPYVIGQVQHEGSGLSLSAGGTKVELTNFNVDPGVSRVYGDVSVNGKTAVTSAYLFTLDGRTLNPLKTGDGTATLQGTKVEISPVAAPLLNKTFKTDAVKAGLLVGTATITVSTTPGD
ncbi:hypothetical protein GCM10011519_23060 [Marmoricola endophyticus]|uniref:Lipoprotein n=1 Tax=Marmoricola endophyticus TaxID=2040280 RepID=A0A917BJP4_9ACTN|nr:hypothetical protein [Marmoricola endophyticus]GGF48446.1 hypothetical protein GCM10011519_23060 [Marmoricola endophyticus]